MSQQSKTRHIVTNSTYKSAEIDLSFLEGHGEFGSGKDAISLAEFQRRHNRVPLYTDKDGKYTVEPSPNYPTDVVDWYKANANENVVETYPFGVGLLSKAGLDKFKKDINVHKPVPLDPNTYTGLSTSVRNDIVNLDADIRDARFKAAFTKGHYQHLRGTWTAPSGKDGKREFKPEITAAERSYLNSLPDMVILQASITGIGGTERNNRAKDPNNSKYSSYNRSVALESGVSNDGVGIEVFPEQLTFEEMGGIEGNKPLSGLEISASLDENDDTVVTQSTTQEFTDEEINAMSIEDLMTHGIPIPEQKVYEYTDDDAMSGGEVDTGQYADANDGFITSAGNDDEAVTASDQDTRILDSIPGGKPQPNMLHRFSSFSTHFEFYMMNPNDFNEIQTSLITNGYNSSMYVNFANKPERLLMSTAGVQRKGYQQDGDSRTSENNRHFLRDYHIDNVSIESYVAPSRKNGGAKFATMQMSVFEPYGATLIENLVKASATEPINGFSYLEMPYMLKVKFQGYDSSGKVVDTMRNPVGAEGTSTSQQQDQGVKYLLMKIGDINFKVTPDGTEYTFDFYNYNSFAMEDYGGTLESNMQVNAKSLGSFFDLSPVDKIFQEQGFEEENAGGVTDFDYEVIKYGPETLGGIKIPGGQYTKVEKGDHYKSFPAILNSIQTEKTKKQKDGKFHQNFADTYKFAIDPGVFGEKLMDEFMGHSIVKPDSIDTNNIPVWGNKVKAASGQTANFLNQTTGNSAALQFAQGTSIIECINQVISTSTFMTSQVTVSSRQVAVNHHIDQTETTYALEGTPEKPLKLYKVTPLVKIGKWDKERKTYQKHYNFLITLYAAEGESQTDMGKAPVFDVVKKYDYLYTGQNTDVLDFDLDFKAGAFELDQIGGFTKGLSAQVDKSSTLSGSSDEDPGTPLSAYRNAIKKVRIDQSKSSKGDQSDYPTVIARNLMSRIYQGGADKLVAELRIMGDPAFITQDEGFGLSAHTSHFSQNGSVNTHKDPIILINFLTPPDISEKTGLMKWQDDRYDGLGNTTSVFSGYYKVMTIRTEISQNVFEQILTLVRFSNQQYDKPDVFKREFKTLTPAPGKQFEHADEFSVSADAIKPEGKGYANDGSNHIKVKNIVDNPAKHNHYRGADGEWVYNKAGGSDFQGDPNWSVEGNIPAVDPNTGEAY